MLLVHYKMQSTWSLSLGNVSRWSTKPFPCWFLGFFGGILVGWLVFVLLFWWWFGGFGVLCFFFYFNTYDGQESFTASSTAEMPYSVEVHANFLKYYFLLPFLQNLSSHPLRGIQNYTTQYLITVWKLQNNSIYYITGCYKRLKRMSFQFH